MICPLNSCSRSCLDLGRVTLTATASLVEKLPKVPTLKTPSLPNFKQSYIYRCALDCLVAHVLKLIRFWVFGLF